ncbi:esterase family protein [Austwickia sp. TVS 96-490-7B]|uniref:alpha/beta hydrolase n=1 Tax=Austwickia sp. TVS 96-490-7B TaxID=2830843 RepID=UPI001C55F100|nr:alpha/beta hydrolase-fold protein [Austwickia sp. TVS 96-490-7B]
MISLAFICLFVAIWVMPQLAGTWLKAISRAGLQILVNVMVILAVATYMNSSNGWYSSWSDLMGAAPKEQVKQDGDAAKAAGVQVPGAAPAAPVPTSYPPLPQPGERLQKYTYTGTESKLTGQIWVYLPHDYEMPEAKDKRYPVIEAFHGFPGSPSGWTSKMNAPVLLDEASSSGRMRDTIFVAPQITIPSDVDSECVNGDPGKAQMETWVSKDVPTFIRKHFRAEPHRDSWAAVGYSIGGYCATLMGMHHSETFGAIANLGGYVKPDFATGAPWAAGSPRAARYDLVAQMKNKPPAVAMYLQVGKQSPFWPDVEAFMGATHAPTSMKSVVLLDGGHRWDLWQSETPKVFAWLGQSIPGFKPRH